MANKAFGENHFCAYTCYETNANTIGISKFENIAAEKVPNIAPTK